MGFDFFHFNEYAFHIREFKNGTDYGKYTAQDINANGDFVQAYQYFHTKTSQELGVFEEYAHQIDYENAYYTIAGPTDNLFEDGQNGLLEIVVLRALDKPWEAYICTEGQTPRDDDEFGFCAAYFESLNN